MSHSEQNKKVAYNIARHLQSQVTAGVLDEDGKEGVESEGHSHGKLCSFVMTLYIQLPCSVSARLMA